MTSFVNRARFAIKLAKNCDKITVYEDNLGQHGLSFAYSKNFTMYGKIISDTMKVMQDKADFDAVGKRWLREVSCATSVSSKQFDWFYFSGILVVMSIMALLSLMLLLCETIYVRLGIHNICYTNNNTNDHDNGHSTDMQYLSVFRTLSVYNRNQRSAIMYWWINLFHDERYLG